MLSYDETLLWVWLNLLLKPGNQTLYHLLQQYDTAEKIYTASRSEYVDILGEKCKEVERLCDKDLTHAKCVIEYCERHNIGILCYADPEFPISLKRIKTPPAVLYWRGTVPSLENKFVLTTVGTRKMSEYGKTVTYQICGDLAKAGAVIVSGMALGIDSVAIASALDSGAFTVAVLGSGLDVIYPPEHAHLYDVICERGWVISEYAPGTPPDAQNFPRRNRIMSALSDAVLVVEGSHKSGALITAEYAIEHGKPLFAVPGRVDCANSAATHTLIQSGAYAVANAKELLYSLTLSPEKEIHFFENVQTDMGRMNAVLKQAKVGRRILRYGELYPKPKKKKTALAEEARPDINDIIPEYQSLALHLPAGEFSMDDIKGYDPAVLNSGFTILMLGKWITALPGGRFRRNF